MRIVWRMRRGGRLREVVQSVAGAHKCNFRGLAELCGRCEELQRSEKASQRRLRQRRTEAWQTREKRTRRTVDAVNRTASRRRQKREQGRKKEENGGRRKKESTIFAHSSFDVCWRPARWPLLVDDDRKSASFLRSLPSRPSSIRSFPTHRLSSSLPASVLFVSSNHYARRRGFPAASTCPSARLHKRPSSPGASRASSSPPHLRAS
jgi:hypothetical protein